MAERLDVYIPWFRRGILGLLIVTFMVIFFTLLALFNLFYLQAIVGSCLWLILVSYGMTKSIKDTGGFRRYYVNYIGTFAGRRFAEGSPDSEPTKLRVGFELFGHRYVQRIVSLKQIKSVSWSQGQSKSWHVFLKMDPPDPDNAEEWARHPGIMLLAESRPKKEAAALALKFVDFLRSLDVVLAQGEKETCFTRVEAEPSSAG